MGLESFPKSRAGYWALSLGALFAAAAATAVGSYVVGKGVSAAVSAIQEPATDAPQPYILLPNK